MSTRRLTESDIDRAIKGRAHRALPLDVVEAQQRAARAPHTSPQGRPEQGWPFRRCSPEMAVYDPAEDDDKREAIDGLGVAVWTVGLIAGIAFIAWLVCAFLPKAPT